MRARLASAAILLLLCLIPGQAGAVPVEDSPTEYYSPVFLTALQVTNKVEFIELYNETATPIYLSGWKLILEGQTGKVCALPLSHWILPGDYVVGTQNPDFADGNSDILLFSDCDMEERIITASLYKDNVLQEKVSSLSSVAYIRKNITKTYRTGDMSKDFYDMSHANARKTLYAGQWYDPPAQTLLLVNEILPSARNCSPIEKAPDCGDFVELMNVTSTPIDLSFFRLRNGYQGQTASPSNTYELAGTIEPGQKYSITAGSDGKLLALTNSGGFVWLEDIYGVRRYDNTIYQYPDASAESKKGKSWAFNVLSNIWEWGSPSPGLDNIFPLPEPPTRAEVETPVACKQGQYRSEETNRCRSVAAQTIAAPCKEGQYRNEETNRCRNISTTVGLAPCTEDQERNPETNRCRKVVASEVPDAAFAVEEIKEAGKAFAGWWALGGIGALALGRGVWEWRGEILSGIRKVGQFFTSGK